MTITELSIRRPALISILFIALGVLGLFGYSKLGSDLLPKMDFPFVSVITYYPGAGPDEIETLVSKPIEEAVAGTAQLDNVRSFSYEGYSVVLGQYLLSASADQAASDVQRRVDLIRAQLPKDALSPKIIKNDISAMPVLRMAMTATGLTSTEAFQLAKDKIKARLEAVEGVAQVNISGGHEREIQVAVDNDKLKGYNLSIVQVQQALQRENLDFPTGKVREPSREFIVRVPGKFGSLEEMASLPLATLPTGTAVHLGDIATIKDTYKEDSQPTRLSGKDAIGLQLIKQSDANATETADKVYVLVEKLQNEYKDVGLHIEYAQDATRFTRSSLEGVFVDLGIAILLVAVVLFLFLRSGRNALIVLIAIPTSLITTFLGMYIFGFTLNLMSLMALSLVIGVLVDDSIVVLENIHRKLDQGMSAVQAAIAGRNEIGFAALAITLVDVVVFLPVSLVNGLAGKIFREFGLTVVSATLISLLVSFTLTPLLASRFAKAHERIKFGPFRWITDRFEAFQDALERLYSRVLKWSLGHRWRIVLGCVILIVASNMLGKNIGQEFITVPDRGEFALNFETPSGTNQDVTDASIRKLEDLLKADKNVDRYLTIIGKQENPWGVIERGNVGQISVKLVDPSKRSVSTNEMMNRLTKVAEQIPALHVRTAPVGIFGTANQDPIQLEIRGDDQAALIAYSDTIMKAVSAVPGLKDLKSSWEEGQPEVKVQFDRDRLANYGLSLGEASMAMRTALGGNTDAKYREGETEYDINVILDRLNRSDANDVAGITLMNHQGQQVKLADVATIFYGKGPSVIMRKNREREVVLYGGLNGRALGDVVADMQTVIAKIHKPMGVDEPYYAGDQENSNKSQKDMGIAFGLAILFVYMIMVALFESYIHPFTIMFSLPVAMVGGTTLLYLFHQTQSLFTMVGMIMLMGLVTKNAILIVDRTNARRALGHGVKESLLEAGPTRLRPILMTTTTMIFGMLPMAIGLSEGADMRRSMAIVIIGGLISSMLLTLMLVPVMYSYIEDLRRIVGKIFKRKNKAGLDLSQFEPALAATGVGAASTIQYSEPELQR
jgi:HAE1 family hydrophobic/amphiphilic exporter-1